MPRQPKAKLTNSELKGKYGPASILQRALARVRKTKSFYFDRIARFSGVYTTRCARISGGGRFCGDGFFVYCWHCLAAVSVVAQVWQNLRSQTHGPGLLQDQTFDPGLLLHICNPSLRPAGGVNHPDSVLAKVGKLQPKEHFDDCRAIFLVTPESFKVVRSGFSALPGKYCKTPLISTYVFSGLAMVQVLIFGAVLTFGGYDKEKAKILQGRSLLNLVLSVDNALLCMFQRVWTYFQDIGVLIFGGYVLSGHCGGQQISVKIEGVLIFGGVLIYGVLRYVPKTRVLP